jgi:hypothetical protein
MRASKGMMPPASASTRSASGGRAAARSCWRRGLLARISGKRHSMSFLPLKFTARGAAAMNSICQPAISQWKAQRGRESSAVLAASRALRPNTTRPLRGSTR